MEEIGLESSLLKAVLNGERTVEARLGSSKRAILYLFVKIFV